MMPASLEEAAGTARPSSKAASRLQADVGDLTLLSVDDPSAAVDVLSALSSPSSAKPKLLRATSEWAPTSAPMSPSDAAAQAPAAAAAMATRPHGQDVAAAMGRMFSEPAAGAGGGLAADAMGPCMSEMPSRVVRRGKGLKRNISIDEKISDLLRQASGKDDDERRVVERSHPAEGLFDAGTIASISGLSSPGDVYQPYFFGKAMNVGNYTHFSLLPHCIGVHCQRGMKPNSPNQDDFFVLQCPEWLCFGVMDGHGEFGHRMSNAAQEVLPKSMLERCCLGKAAAAESQAMDWRSAASDAFHEVAAGLKERFPKESRASGTTASVAFLGCGPAEAGHGALRLRSAYVGDSSIVYGRRPTKGGSWEVRQLGQDHKPDREDEHQRIKEAGGEVLPSVGHRFPPRLLCSAGALAMSRSLGDFSAAEVGLTCEPEVPTEVDFEEGYEHVVLICSDGVWDMVEPLAAVQLVARFTPENTQAAAEKLAAKAQSRWQQQEPGMIDDITVCLVKTVVGG